MCQFLGLLMGQQQKPKLTDYWVTREIYHTPFFSKIMMTTLLLTQIITVHFINKFSAVYTPKQMLLLDEGMIPWRGTAKFRVFMSNKHDKYGIKLYILCEAVYSGDGKTIPDIVFDLLSDLKGKGYCLVMDN
ncbi:hypothetical protein PR048_010916 [Dryococelus australis]|uniref:PiggyBac transposable element-derived protein domain-containing protein n=1 Tax=Dryococelus australis TaxID=614101 RepID=A0ABQ9I529_9NEOP|nr:hypothetical protein PR048_010916 [Dryococelus australis]